MNQIHHLLITAPTEVREKYRRCVTSGSSRRWPACRPASVTASWAVLTALKTLAQRHQFLAQQADLLEQQLRALVQASCPQLLACAGSAQITAPS